MSQEPAAKMHSHVAVHMEPYIVVLGGKLWENRMPLSPHEIWMYNIYTEQWRKYKIPDYALAPHSIVAACAVAVDENVYLFGGVSLPADIHSNVLWKLSRTFDGCFMWRNINNENIINSPSPRESHTGWEYEGMLWTFGGAGASHVGYLHDHGDFMEMVTHNSNVLYYNNQLLCFDPFCNKWTDIKCSGSVPTPRAGHGTGIIRNKVWLFGGRCDIAAFNDLFEINMCTLNWTHIQTDEIKPKGRYWYTLNAISDDKLVVHCGKQGIVKALSDTWIFNLTSHTWKQYTAVLDHSRWCHTGTNTIKNSILIIGGVKGRGLSYDNYRNTFQVMLEPRSLQQMAMQTAYKHRTELPWKFLPRKLIARFGILKSEEDTVTPNKRHLLTPSSNKT